jgi:hypothetical protein
MLVVEASGPDSGEELISQGEYDALSRLYNDVQREHGGVLPRLTRIERALRDLEVLDGDRAPTADAALDVIAVDKRADDLDNDRLVEFVFQLVRRRIRRRASPADALVVLGCDRVRHDALESLITDARQSGTQTFLYFERLRQDAVEVIGAGGAAAGFFALANHREAREASDFIGSEYRFVESQRTRSSGESLTVTYGEESSSGQSWGGTGPPTSSESWGTSFSRALTQSTEYSVSDQRVHEALMEPEVVMGLPATAMLHVEVRTGGRRVVRTVDCHPARCLDPRVSREPRA